MPSKDGKLRVLALEGGGIRGLLAASILRFIEEYTGRPIYQSFDLICGTSTGGLMALALTKPAPLSAKQCCELYLNYGSTIFSRSKWRSISTLGGMSGSKYDGLGLQRVLSDTFGSQTLENALIPTFVVSYCLDSRLPSLHRSWRPTAAPRRLVDVALATSAAPTYFPPAQVEGHWHIDGGTVANSPSLSGLIECCKLNDAHTRDCIVLSIGTGLCKQPISPQSALGWGKVGWVAPLIDIMLDGVPDLTDAQMSDLMPDAQYLHLEPTIPASVATLDDTSSVNLRHLQAIGENVVDLQKGPLVALLNRL